MSNKMYNWAKKLRLPRGEKTTLLILANSFNDKKGYCWPTNKDLAAWCSCDERTIRRHIKSLISKNIIQKEDVRDHLGRRKTSKYTFNIGQNVNEITPKIEQDLDSLPDKNACGKLIRLPDILSSLPDINDTPTGHTVRKDYIINKNKTKDKHTHNFSLDDKNEQTKLEFLIGVKFDQTAKVNDDTCDLENARKLHKQICLENKRSIQFAENLLTARKQQKQDRDKLIGSGEFVPALCNLTNWLKGERWNDIIKPLGEKKKVSPYIKCKICGEEYLKGTHCKICARKSEIRVAAHA